MGEWRIVYAWDDGWGEEHWCPCPIRFVDGQPLVNSALDGIAQGVEPDGIPDCLLVWTAEELNDELPADDPIRDRKIILYAGDDATIDELPITLNEYLANPRRGFDWWMELHDAE